MTKVFGTKELDRPVHRVLEADGPLNPLENTHLESHSRATEIKGKSAWAMSRVMSHALTSLNTMPGREAVTKTRQ